MQRNTVTPIADLAFRPPEAGRIRLGTSEPNGKNKKPIKLKTFRFTSRQRELIDTLAGMYGGTVGPWNDQWEVISTTDEIEVILFPDGLGQDYEVWDGGALVRRCDGVEAEISTAVSDYDYAMVKHPCICARNNAMECKLKTRLQVMLPSLAFAGTWRVESSGFNAGVELPGMYDMITTVQERGGMVSALLGLEERTKIVTTNRGKQTRRFIVPKLGVKNTMLELAQGRADLTAISAAGSGVITPALPSGQPAAPSVSEGEYLVTGAPTRQCPHCSGIGNCDTCGSLGVLLADNSLFDEASDGIDDAEIVDDELLAIEAEIKGCAEYFGLDGDRLIAALKMTSRLDDGELDRARLNLAITKMKAGEIVPIGFRADGRTQWKT